MAYYPPDYRRVGLNNDGRMPPAEVVQFSTKSKPVWFQGDAQRRVKKPYYHLVWPKDKNRGMFGRLKDVLQNKGPDIYLSVSARKNEYSTNRPLHGRWSNWPLLDPRITGSISDLWPGQHKFSGPCWVSNSKVFGRDANKRYNFQTRKYEDEHPGMWTDAIWQGPHKDSNWPDQYRNRRGLWLQDDNWDPSFPGQDINDI